MIIVRMTGQRTERLFQVFVLQQINVAVDSMLIELFDAGTELLSVEMNKKNKKKRTKLIEWSKCDML